MLQMAKANGFHFDAVLFPSNVMDWNFRSFVHEVMPVALREGVAVRTMKPMGGRFVLKSKVVTPAECLRYTLSQPTSVVIHGMEKMQYLDEALDAVKNFQPMTPAGIAAVTARTKEAAMRNSSDLRHQIISIRPPRIRNGWVE
jgi:aryl-alcohol dehydrogenase-like predicted oxidoreductase